MTAPWKRGEFARSVHTPDGTKRLRTKGHLRGAFAISRYVGAVLSPRHYWMVFHASTGYILPGSEFKSLARAREFVDRLLQRGGWKRVSTRGVNRKLSEAVIEVEKEMGLPVSFMRRIS